MAENQPNGVWPRTGLEPASAADHQDFDNKAAAPACGESREPLGKTGFKPTTRLAIPPGVTAGMLPRTSAHRGAKRFAASPALSPAAQNQADAQARGDSASAPRTPSSKSDLEFDDFSAAASQFSSAGKQSAAARSPLRAAARALSCSPNPPEGDAGDFDESASREEAPASGDEKLPSAAQTPAALPPKRGWRFSFDLGECLLKSFKWTKGFAFRHAIFILLLITFEAVVAPGLFVRVFPMYGDEIDLAHRYVPIQANNLQSIFSVNTTHFGMHNLDFAARALVLRASRWMLSHRDIAMRLVNFAIAGALLTAIYAFGTAFWGRLMGLAMAFTAAFSHYSLFLTINGYYCNETGVAILAGAGFLIAGLYSNKRLPAALLMAASSFFSALSYMLYFTGRLACVIFMLVWGLEFTQRKDFWRIHWWKAALWAVCLGLLLIMPIRAVRARPEKGDARKAQVSLLNRQNMNNFLNVTKLESIDDAIILNVKLAFRAFFMGPNSYHAYRTRYPYVDRFSGILLVLGILLALWHWRELRYGALLGLWIAYNALPAGLTTLESPPYHPRAHAGILFGWMLVALPLGWALEKAAKWRKDARERKAPEAIAAGSPAPQTQKSKLWLAPIVEITCTFLLLALAIYNTRIYYQKFHFNFKNPSVAEWRLYDEIARYYQSSGPTTCFIMANTNATLLTWTNQVTTQNRSPGVHWDFDALKRNGELKFIRPNRVVVVQALAERVPEVRAVLKKSNYKWREIRETVPEIRVDYTYFVLGRY